MTSTSSLPFLANYNADRAAALYSELSHAATSQWSRFLADPVRAMSPWGVWDNTARALQWYTESTRRTEPKWASRNKVVLETPIARMRDFSPSSADKNVTPTLVLPPQAGHSSTIVDFSSRQSQMATIIGAGLEQAYSLEWLAATAATRNTSVTDYLGLITTAIEQLGGKVNLVGDCQGGWLAAIYAALNPARINTLTLAGAPIDFHAGESVIAAQTIATYGAMGMAPYKALVAAGGGNMPGEFVLGGFIAIKPEAELGKQLRLLDQLDDPSQLRRYAEFEDWFKHTQSIPGTFYLWLIEHLFAGNELIDGRLVIDGKKVDLGAITCPLFLLAGETDHITPPAQMFATADAVSTPKTKISKRTTSGGHLGLFMGRDALRNSWAPLMAEVAEYSHSGSKPRGDRKARADSAAAVVVADETRAPIPAP